MAVLSKEIYSAQNFVEILTGNYYVFKNDTTRLVEVETLLSLNGFEDLWNYPLIEINHIVENNIDVVLADVSDYDIESGNWVAEYRWFEIPESCCNSFKES